MNTRKLILSFVFLIILTSAVGLTYAHWYDSVTYEAVVQTGSYSFVFPKDVSETTIPAYGEPWDDVTIRLDKGSEFGGPYVTADWGLSDRVDDCLTENWGYATMWVEIYNAYPGIVAARTVVLENIGTTPLHLNGINVYDPCQIMQWEWIQPFEATDPVEYQGVIYSADNCMGYFWIDGLVPGEDPNGEYDEEEAVMLIWFSHGKVLQLHQGGKDKGEFDIYFLQPLEECQKYCFEIQYLSDQWNWAGTPMVPPV